MAKATKGKQDSVRKNPKPKSTRWSATTQMNKARRAEARQRRAQRRDDNRKSLVISVAGNDGAFKGSRGAARAAFVKAAEQAKATLERVNRKRATRERLRSMSKKDRAAASLAGQRQFGSNAAEWHKLGITQEAWKRRGHPLAETRQG